jgi:cell volume regulation protein A
MFLLLGLLVTPRELGDILWPALALAVFLMLIARPLAVWVCLLPFRFPHREQLFVGWVGLRGAVPIVLGMFPLLAGVPQARDLFDVAFVVVLASLLLQGSTVALAARATGVTLPPHQDPLMRVQVGAAANEPMELARFAIRAGTALAGQAGANVSIPGGSRLVSVLRQGSSLEPRAAGTLRAADEILLLGTESAIDRAAGWLGTTDTATIAARRAAFGEFMLDARAPAASLLEVYGVDTREVEGLTLEDLLLRRLGKAPVPGDGVSIGQVRLTVVETDQGRIVKIGLALPH